MPTQPLAPFLEMPVLRYLLALVVGLCGLATAYPAAPLAIAQRSGVEQFPPFDLTYLPASGAQGIVGLRPAALARQVPVEAAGQAYQLFLGIVLQYFVNGNMNAAKPPPLGDIEECVCGISLVATFPSEEARGSLIAGMGTPCVLRTKKPFDWIGTITKWCPHAEKVRRAGREYWKMPIPLLPGSGSFAFFSPDERTVVMADEAQMRKLLARLKSGKHGPTPPPGWKKVDTSLIAVAFGTRKTPCVKGEWPEEPAEIIPARKLIEGAGVITAGFTIGERTTMKIIVTSKDEAGARDVFHAGKWLFARAAAEVGKVASAKHHPLVGQLQEMLETIKGSQSGRTVRAEISTAGDLFKALSEAMPPCEAVAEPVIPPPPPVPGIHSGPRR